MAWTQEDLDKVRAAIASGVSTVQFRDRLVVYRSIEQLQLAEKEIASALAGRPKQTIGYQSTDGF